MRRAAWALLLLALLLCLSFPAAVLALADGGPEPVSPQPGVREYRPRVEAWALVSASGAGGVGGLLCSHERPCEAAALDAAAARGGTCVLAMDVWLASAPREELALRDVGLLVYAVAWAGGGEVRPDGVWNSSAHLSEFPVAWPHGWWWRAESERIHLAVPTPCDAWLVVANVNVRGVDLLGREQHAAQAAEVALVPDRPRGP